MNRNVSYKILPELRLIIEYYSGIMEVDDIIELKRMEIKDEKYNPNFNFIVSITDIRIDRINQEAASKLVEFMKEDVKIVGKRRSAILTATPEQVAASIIHREESKELPIYFKTVSTVQAAIDWILLPKEYESTVVKNIELLKDNVILQKI